MRDTQYTDDVKFPLHSQYTEEIGPAPHLQYTDYLCADSLYTDDDGYHLCTDYLCTVYLGTDMLL